MATTTRRTTKKKAKTTKRTTSAADASKARTRSQIYGEIAAATELTKRDIQGVFEYMTDLIRKDLSKRGPGTFTVPGLLKIVRQYKPHRPARKGVNPFTGEPTTFKAKPAHNVVKVRALKALKEMV